MALEAAALDELKDGESILARVRNQASLNRTATLHLVLPNQIKMHLITIWVEGRRAGNIPKCRIRITSLIGINYVLISLTKIWPTDFVQPVKHIMQLPSNTTVK